MVIAGTRSGAGKTTISLGIMAALARRGLKVAPFKVGPDFIDPGHHTRITGVTSRNLDGWMLSQAYNLNTFYKGVQNADVAVVEGVMGLYDGFDGRSDAGSTAQMAKWAGLPVVLAVDAKSMARSAAAMVQGFERFDPELKFAGVIFNSIGSTRHLHYLKEALEGHVQMPCLGGLSRDEKIAMPERHLGLVTQNEFSLSDQAIEKLADFIDDNIDLDALLKTLPELPENPAQSSKAALTSAVRVGVAMDDAFCFYYKENLEIMADSGAEIVPFSPVNDAVLPENLDGLYFGGGYPEVFASQLAENRLLRHQVKENSRKGMPIYGECGGFMYLCREIYTTDGRNYPMSGCFPFSTSMFKRLKSLGYREITLRSPAVIGKSGQIVRGHEFHYSGLDKDSIDEAIPKMYSVTDRLGHKNVTEGYRVNNTLGSYIHLHFGSCPEAARHFVNACAEYRNTQESR